MTGGEFLTVNKASLVMLTLETWILLSLGAYYVVYTKKFVELSITMPIAYVPAVIIFIFNYIALHYKDRWKQFNTEFDNYSNRISRIGSWIVFGVVVLIISNLIYSFYLMSLIDWSKYR